MIHRSLRASWFRTLAPLLLVTLVTSAGFSYGVMVGRYQFFPFRYVAPAGEMAKSLLRPDESPTSRNVIESTFVRVTRSTFDPAKYAVLAGKGGALTMVADDILGVDAKGQFFLYRKGGDMRLLDLRVPMNNEAFEDYVAAHTTDSRLSAGLTEFFRVLDMDVRERDRTLEIYVLHNFWLPGAAAKTVRLSKLELSGVSELADAEAHDHDWDTVYDSQPFISYDESPFSPFRISHTGGRIAFDHEGGVLIGLGNHAYGESANALAASQDDASSYGKILRIDPVTSRPQIFARGIRNPQGLLLAEDGTLWETEHGPQGGDELNIIERGQNYGWPLVTYGTDYGRSVWPLSREQGRHHGYRAPVFAWLPSIGVSNLIELTNAPATWKGDLLIASLRAKELSRLRLEDGRVVFAETLDVGTRVRDLIELRDGTIVLWTDTPAVIELHLDEGGLSDTILDRLTAKERALGLAEIVTGCRQCHDLRAGAGSASGPSLWGVVGRKIAHSPYPHYSAALKQQSGVWDYDRLWKYLSNPQGFAPGTTMPDPRLDREDVLTGLIEVLGRLE